MAITLAPGQAVPQPEWDELTKQHGESKGEPSRVSRTQAEIQAAALAGDDDPAGQRRPIYRYYFGDGTYVDARTSPNYADYQVVDYKPSPKFQQTQTAAGQAANRPTVGRVEGTPTGQADPSGQPAYDNTKPIWVERDEAGKQVGAAKPLTADQREQ